MRLIRIQPRKEKRGPRYFVQIPKETVEATLKWKKSEKLVHSVEFDGESGEPYLIIRKKRAPVEKSKAGMKVQSVQELKIGLEGSEKELKQLIKDYWIGGASVKFRDRLERDPYLDKQAEKVAKSLLKRKRVPSS